MILSRACTYGIQAVVYAAIHNEKGFLPISQVANELNIPFHFLTKVLQVLTDRGYVISKRGANGGIMLAKSSSAISLLEVVEAIDGNAIFEECILGLPGCGHATPCPLHQHWAQHRTEFREHFRETSLAELVRNVRERSLRISSITDILPT